MKCTPDRIQPRIMSMRRLNTPWEDIASRLGISVEEVHANTREILDRHGLKELNKDTMEDLTRRIQRAQKGLPAVQQVTPRQMECLRLYSTGLSYKEIALAVSLRNSQTVQNHVSTACRALGIVHAGRHRLQRVQEHFAKQAHPQTPTPTEPDPMSDPAFN